MHEIITKSRFRVMLLSPLSPHWGVCGAGPLRGLGQRSGKNAGAPIVRWGIVDWVKKIYFNSLSKYNTGIVEEAFCEQ